MNVTQSIAPATDVRQASKISLSVCYRAVEEWLERHLTAIAVAIIAAAFVTRLWVAAQSYLNPDEALIYIIINQPSLWQSYKLSLTEPHPPLFYVLLYFWRYLGRSELMLRLPSVFAGTAFCWFIYKWVRQLFGKASGLTSLILAAFLPPVVSLSAQMRMYALLLLSLAAALYSLERALAANSRHWMWGFSLCLYVAILTHYSSVFFAFTAGVYVLARLAKARPPRALIETWSIGQVGALGIYVLLYMTHLSGRKGVVDTWNTPSYFHWGSASVFSFTRERTMQLFEFMFANRSLSLVMLLLFLAAIAVLISGHLRNRLGEPQRYVGVLCLLPLAAVWVTAVAGIYPYGGTRHTIFLVPFVVAALSELFAVMQGRQLWASLLVATLLVGTSSASGMTSEPYIRKEDQQRALMMDAIDHLRQSVAKDEVIFVDYQSSFLLVYYLCGPNVVLQPTGLIRGFYRFVCNGHTIITNYAQWKMTSDDFPQRFQDMVRVQRLKPGDRVWLFQAGWDPNLDVKPAPNSPALGCGAAANFGENITVIPFLVGTDRAAVPATAGC